MEIRPTGEQTILSGYCRHGNFEDLASICKPSVVVVAGLVLVRVFAPITRGKSKETGWMVASGFQFRVFVYLSLFAFILPDSFASQHRQYAFKGGITTPRYVYYFLQDFLRFSARPHQRSCQLR